MWNLLPNGPSSTTYRPSAYTGTPGNPTLAYDIDTYPWATCSTATNAGSAVAGTPDDTIFTLTTFPTLSKAAFSSVDLYYVFSASGTVPFAATYVITAGFTIQYSTDGGSTWTDTFISGTTYIKGGLPFLLSPPAQDYSDTGIENALFAPSSKLVGHVLIPSGDLTTGLQDLQIRFVTSTLTSVRGGSPASTVSYQVWDVQAEVS